MDGNAQLMEICARKIPANRKFLVKKKEYIRKMDS